MAQAGFTAFEMEIKTTQLTTAVNALCDHAGLERSNANAKKVAAEALSAIVTSVEQSQVSVEKVVIQ